MEQTWKLAMKRALLACLLCMATLPAWAQNAWTVFPLDGPDRLTDGYTFTFTSTNSNFTLRSLAPNAAAVQAIVVAKDDPTLQFEFRLYAPIGERLQPGFYPFAERGSFAKGRAPGIEVFAIGGCNEINGWFAIRQIAFDSKGEPTRLEAVAVVACDGSLRTGIAVSQNAPQLHFNVTAPEFGHSNVTYWGDTTRFGLATSGANKFRYLSSGDRDVWTMNLTAPIGQAQFARGVYLTEGTATTSKAGMDIAYRNMRRAEYGKFEILTIAYRNGEIVQLSARWYFYSDAARTKVVRSGRINFWK